MVIQTSNKCDPLFALRETKYSSVHSGTLNRDEYSDSRPGRFNPEERGSGMH